MKTGTMTTTILKMRRCVCRLTQTGSPSIGQIQFKPIYAPLYIYIYIYIYWYFCLPVSTEAVFQIYKSVRVCLYLCRLPEVGITCIYRQVPDHCDYVPTSMTPNRIADWTAMEGIISPPPLTIYII